MVRLDPSCFDWTTWRNGNLLSIFGFDYRVLSLNKKAVIKSAYGYCKAYQLPCRPKYNGEIAVMFFDGVNDWWTHFTKDEFETIFTNVKL